MPPLAGSGRRLIARIIDALIVAIPVNIVLSLVGVIRWSGDDDRIYDANLGASGITAVVYFLYEGYMFSRSGQTFGKRWMGIRVAMLENGAVPAGAPAWIRSLVYSACGWVCCLWPINVLWHLFDRPFRQCLHDKAARTVVVSAR